VGITVETPSCSTATQQFVVPRSMPIMRAMVIST
jgi:hypothetical protein